MARKKQVRKQTPLALPEPFQGEVTGEDPDDYLIPQPSDLQRLNSLEQNVANHEGHIFELKDVIEALVEYLEVDIVPAEEVMPRGRLVAIERSEMEGGEEDND